MRRNRYLRNRDLRKMPRKCFICRDRKKCELKEYVSYTGCCSFKDLKIIRMIKNILGIEK